MIFSDKKNKGSFILDWGLPIGLFFIYYFFYNHAKITPSELIKTSGLCAIALLSITIVIGPLSRLFPSVSVFKANRKAWGLASFFYALIHASLVFVIYFKLNLFELFNPDKPKFIALFVGVLSLIILIILTLISNRSVEAKLGKFVWKSIQGMSYVALFLAVAHFFLVEHIEGVFTIKRFLGKVTYWFAAFVVLVRFIVSFLPSKEKL